MDGDYSLNRWLDMQESVFPESSDHRDSDLDVESTDSYTVESFSRAKVGIPYRNSPIKVLVSSF